MTSSLRITHRTELISAGDTIASVDKALVRLRAMGAPSTARVDFSGEYVRAEWDTPADEVAVAGEP